MKKQFGDYLRTLRIERDMTQQELADILGTSKQVVSKYENNLRTPKVTAAVEYAKALKVPLSYLLRGIHPTDNPEENTVQIKKIPLVGQTAAGWPISAEEHIEDWVIADEGDNVDYALRVKGDSMTGVGIYDGDLIFVRKQPTVNNGEIAVVIIDDGHPDTSEATCKRFYQYGKTVLLRPESHNPSHKEQEIILGKGINVRVHGKVIFLKGRIEGR
ncbi:MAG: helix-turn-helix domain-containing protein [Defluviitaleaceae bacterium]|nr:helix-turn-helix domain-containing protein [Defluviitaleaceae bacterium]